MMYVVVPGDNGGYQTHVGPDHVIDDLSLPDKAEMFDNPSDFSNRLSEIS